MHFAFEKNLCYFDEGLQAIAEIVNKRTVCELKERLIKKNLSKSNVEKLSMLFKDEIYLINLIKDSIDTEDETTKFLFTDINGLTFPLAFVFSERFKQSKVEAILDYLYGTIYGKHYEEYFDSSLTKTGDDLYKAISGLVLDNHVKFSIMRLYYDYDILKEFALEKISKASKIIKENMGMFSNKINELMKFVEEEVNKNGLNFFKDKTKLRLNDDSDYVFYPSIMLANALTFHGNNNEEPTLIVVGINLFDILEIINDKKNDENIYDFFKVISDKTKFDIIKMLSKERLYNAQIAERLKLSTATISYHMNQLINANIILVEKENNKVFYILDKENIKFILEQFVEIIS